jgi:hypothetical protein
VVSTIVGAEICGSEALQPIGTIPLQARKVITDRVVRVTLRRCLHGDSRYAVRNAYALVL